MTTPSCPGKLVILLLPALLGWAGCSLAAPVNSDGELTEEIVQAPADETPVVVRMLKGVEGGRDAVSRGVGNIGESVDAWLGGDVEPDKANRSYLRVRLKQDFYQGGEREGDYSLRGHLDLPRSKKRWRLFFDSDNQDQETLASKKLLNRNTGEQVAGVSRDRKTDWFSIRHDVGLRGNLPLDSFYRFRFRTGTPLAERWRLDFEQRAWYYHSKGWGEKSQLRFSRPLGGDRVLAFTSEAQYQDRYDQFELGQSVAIGHILGPFEALHYEAGALGTSQPEPDVNQYYLQVGYTRSLHEDWVIFSATPQIAFPRTRDWEARLGIFFNLDIYFYAL